MPPSVNGEELKVIPSWKRGPSAERMAHDVPLVYLQAQVSSEEIALWSSNALESDSVSSWLIQPTRDF